MGVGPAYSGLVRLPRPAPGQAVWWVLGSTAIVAATAVMVWFALAASLAKPTWQTLGWIVQDARSVDVKFEVRRPDGMTVRCTVLAKDLSHAVVGSLDVDLPAEWGRSVAQTTRVRTTSQAVMGEVRTCREVGDAPR
jgi:hypothetical protein